MNNRIQHATAQQSLGLGQFLTVLILCVAVLAAAVLWNRSRALSVIQVDGWKHVAVHYRDSVLKTLRSELDRGALGSLREVEQRVEAFPFVQTVIARKIGSTLQVTVTERVPVALVRVTNGDILWMDAAGKVIPYKAFYRDITVPMVNVNSSSAAPGALPILQTLQNYPQLEAACSEM